MSQNEIKVKLNSSANTRLIIQDINEGSNQEVILSHTYSSKVFFVLTPWHVISRARREETGASHTNRDLFFSNHTVSCLRNIIKSCLEPRLFALIPCPHACVPIFSGSRFVVNKTLKLRLQSCLTSSTRCLFMLNEM